MKKKTGIEKDKLRIKSETLLLLDLDKQGHLVKGLGEGADPRTTSSKNPPCISLGECPAGDLYS